MSALEHDSAVSTEYVHTDKLVRPEPSLMLGGATLKWYDIAPDEEPVPLAVRALARRNLRDAAKSGELGLSEDELGFVVLHRCGGSFYFLLVCTWRNENELWETVWAKPDARAVSFKPWPREESHVPTFCVWELAAVCHERLAWTDYLRSGRDDEARRSYLRSCYEGLA
jgi:hypothetical protein